MVSTHQILEELWGEEAEGKENSLWIYISRLRAVLETDRGEPSVLLTKDHGYSLSAEPSSVDAFRFESAVASGRSALKGDPEAASETLREALSLWRGPALEDFRYDEFAQAEIRRLEELRETTMEDHIEADLRQGKSSELVGELEVLCEAHPLRERPVSLKMLALYRAGRQAEALQTFERFRKALGEEMGIEPSPELGSLEEQILLHDSRLQARLPYRRGVAATTESAMNPFKGLQAFHEADTDLFFGRDRLVADVVRRLADRQLLVTVVGPSGSGKSSAVRAGAIPSLRKNAIAGSDLWLIAQMVPGSHPFAELEAGLLRSTIDAPDSLTDRLRGNETGILRAAMRVLPEDTSKILIIIDQFEELFTLVDDGETRNRFLDGLTEAVGDPHGRVMVILTLRADFYERPLQHAAFGTRMGAGIVNVVPMTPDELEQAANAPAAQAGVTLEPSLLASLLTDVVGQPGALPLFQYTLTDLFNRRVGNTLDITAYKAMGGLRGALTLRAEELFDRLTDEEKLAARQLFLRLVTIADSDEWSRRRVPASEIISLDVDVVALQGVIDTYAAARLLTLDRDFVTGSPTVEVAHEALLTEWDRLREWIDEGRDDIRRHASLAAASAEWRSSAESVDYLLAGTRLAEFENWAGQTTLSLTTGDRAFLDASVVERETRGAIEQERSAREKALGRRARRRLWGVAAATAVLLGVGLFFLVNALAPDGPTVVLFMRADEPVDDAIRAGFESAAAGLQIEEMTVVSAGFPAGDPISELRALSEQAPDLVVVTPGLTPPVAVVAGDFQEVSYVVVDSRLGGMANVSSPSIAEVGGSYLMGVAAALKSETGVVGLVGAWQVPQNQEFVAGFEAGVKNTDPTTKVLVRWLGPVDPGLDSFVPPEEDPVSAKLAAEELIDAGADVIFQLVGDAGVGITAAVAELSEALGRPIWTVGGNVDAYASASGAERAVVLTSNIRRYDLAITRAIEVFLNDSFAPGVMDFNMSPGDISFSESGDQVGELVPVLEEVRRNIRGGGVKVPKTVDFVPGWWPTPDVTVDVVYNGDSCDIEGSPAVTAGDRVTVRYRNETGLRAGVAVWVDDSGLTMDDLEAFAIPVLIQRGASAQSGWQVSPGGTTEIQGLATRASMIINCATINGLNEDTPAGIIPVMP